jgi:hypothetical protein
MDRELVFLCNTVGSTYDPALMPSIFLAGPIERWTPDYGHKYTRWRDAAVGHLRRNYQFHETDIRILNPERDERPEGWSYEMQVEWEVEAMRNATCILCWIERIMPDLPAFTTNIEVGQWLTSPKLIVGAPPDTPHTRYIKTRRQMADLDWFESLVDCCDVALKYAVENHTK